jgi:acetylornithine/succinyldiaminopimelate/putrescine aminotransferase
MKLAKRFTNRSEVIAFNNSYHGSTQGALSIMGSEYWRNAFRPLLPGIFHFDYNSPKAINAITEQTSCVIVETVQGEAGVITPSADWIQSLRKKCTETGTLLILDEIQTGFGRTGKLWGFEHFNIIPDILLLGKALGGSMPLGAFIADKEIMSVLTENPVLGHITTFGGHPVCCAAGLAALKALLDEGMMNDVKRKGELFKSLLVHKKIKSFRSFGLWLAVEFDSFEANKMIIDRCIANGVLTDWFLFASNCLRISPPLTITDEQVKKTCEILLKAIN